jgi:hypothetical protein
METKLDDDLQKKQKKTTTTNASREFKTLLFSYNHMRQKKHPTPPRSSLQGGEEEVTRCGFLKRKATKNMRLSPLPVFGFFIF